MICSLGDAPQPLDDMPANFFAISATPQGGAKQSFALVTPQNYTQANAALPPRREAHVSQHEVRRMQVMMHRLHSPAVAAALTSTGGVPAAAVDHAGDQGADDGVQVPGR